MFTKEQLENAKKARNVVVLRNEIQESAQWKDISSVYDVADSHNIRHVSFASMAIVDTQVYTDKYNKVIETIKEIHGGELIGAMSILHFFTGNSNELSNPDAIEFREKFIQRTPHQQPEVLPPHEDFAPTIHIDDVDGFFIQNEGETLWRIFKDEGTQEHHLRQGDIMYIPKFTVHSVESLTPRHSVSIAFKDPRSAFCSYCKR